ncbi:MAG: penicillin-binding protein 1C [Bacteroidales bacterium]|nr:penicillin-binding protein 1C [Bacteroidales bacterium]
MPKKVKKILKLSVILLLIIIYWQILPSQLFNDPYCTVIKDCNGELLGAHIAEDGQYRFPLTEKVPDKFKEAIITFEDKRFRYHWGVDIISLGRAIKQNLSAGKVISGGSTITMQVIRLSRKGKKRTVWEKIIEIILATRLEFSYSKTEILAMYASHAPFGGNVVGIDAASWRYFGVNSDKLSWAQAATLAVLPNAPALIHPGRNRNALFKKRNRLLKRLYEKDIIDIETYELAKEEEVPEITKSFPSISRHLLMKVKNEGSKVVKTTLKSDLQEKVNEIVKRHHRRLSGNQINNLAVLVIEVETGDVSAYIGNINDFSDNSNENSVDIITSERSTGSILKPFLYASMLTEGEILPNTLIYDIPTRIGGYTPKNYSRGYDGAVPAHKALARSLNIPAVIMLREYGNKKLYKKLEDIGMTTLHNNADYYGLSLILGGCEGTLWDICGIYASMARTLNHYEEYGYQYDKNDFHPPVYILKDKQQRNIDEDWQHFENSSYFSASAIYLTFQAMLDVERPDDDNNWEMFQSSERIAWKTGTSFGFRDAWAIGVTPEYVVGVWAGNADGEGRPGIVGVRAAAPVLFDVFDILPDAQNWFTMPEQDMIKAEICKKSGHLASLVCDDTEEMWIPSTGNRTDVCPYHTLIYLDETEQYRVNGNCESVSNIVSKPWFILPPSVEFYYKKRNASYKYLPPYRYDCSNNIEQTNKDMELIYPFHNSKIYVPVDLDGKLGKTVFEAAHRNKKTTIFWYVDSKLVGKTIKIHQIELSPKEGEHILTLVDEKGEKLIKKFEITGRNK